MKEGQQISITYQYQNFIFHYQFMNKRIDNFLILLILIIKNGTFEKYKNILLVIIFIIKKIKDKNRLIIKVIILETKHVSLSNQLVKSNIKSLLD